MDVPGCDEQPCPFCLAGTGDVSAGGELEPTWLAHLYRCRGLSTYQIAARTGIERQRVTRTLRKAGMSLRPRGSGRLRPVRRPGDPADLPRLMRELYQEAGLNSRQIAVVLGMPERTVRARLRRYGVKTRTRGGWNREDRTIVPASALLLLYSELGMTAAEAGRRLGLSADKVLRAAHAHGIPVRSGGAVPLPGPDEIELVRALYTDPLIDAVLTAHNIPRVPPGGPVSERFPEPVPLTTPLVKDLYWGCGVGLNHVELLTGQAASSVRGFMRREGVALRNPGGRTPFLRRWRSRLADGEEPGGRLIASRHPQPAFGEQPARDHIGRPVHAEVNPAGADPGASQQCRGPQRATADTERPGRGARPEHGQGGVLGRKAEPFRLDQPRRGGRALPGDQPGQPPPGRRAARHGEARRRRAPPTVPAGGYGSGDREDGIDDARLGQGAHRVRDPGGRRPAPGADRLEGAAVGAGQPAVIRSSRQDNDPREGHRGGRQPPGIRHRRSPGSPGSAASSRSASAWRVTRSRSERSRSFSVIAAAEAPLSSPAARSAARSRSVASA